MSKESAITDNAAAFDFQPGGQGTAKLRLSGCLDLRSTASLWRILDAQLRQTPITTLEVDASGVEHCNGAGLALLHFLSPGGLSPFGGKTTVVGLRPEFLSLFQKFTAEDSSEIGLCRSRSGRSSMRSELQLSWRQPT